MNTEVKHRPILFSGEMVRAILEGRKTQTRRVVKFPKRAIEELGDEEITLTRMQDGYKDGTRPVWGCDDEPNWFSTSCPYGKPGDVLWVREACAHTNQLNIHPSDENYGVVYKADGEPWEDYEGWRWRPSIHMPKAVCRLFLKIKSVRVERLQDITEADAVAEGVEKTLDGYKNYCWRGSNAEFMSHTSAERSFYSLWIKINGPESLNANPWVWVVEFEKCDKPENF